MLPVLSLQDMGGVPTHDIQWDCVLSVRYDGGIVRTVNALFGPDGSGGRRVSEEARRRQKEMLDPHVIQDPSRDMTLASLRDVWTRLAPATAVRIVLAKFGRRAYLPNFHSKGWDDFQQPSYPENHAEICQGFDCPSLASHPNDRPDESWCWGGSFFWHLLQVKRREAHGVDACMVQVVEGGVLGPGQRLEVEMARALGLRIVSVHVADPTSFAPLVGADLGVVEAERTQSIFEHLEAGLRLPPSW